MQVSSNKVIGAHAKLRVWVFHSFFTIQAGDNLIKEKWECQILLSLNIAVLKN